MTVSNQTTYESLKGLSRNLVGCQQVAFVLTGWRVHDGILRKRWCTPLKRFGFNAVVSRDAPR
jgi:hypothetical protein